MQASLESAARVAGEKYGHAFVVMHIRVSQWRSVKNQRVIQQGAVAVGHLLQLVHEVRNHADMVLVDCSELSDSLLVLSVVGRPVESARHAAFRKSSSRGIAAQLKGG